MSLRSALVTGASTGIGYAIAGALLDDGYAVTICARTPERLEVAAANLRKRGEVLAVPADVTAEDDVTELVGSHERRFGRLDVLANNAGIGAIGALSQTPSAELDRLIAANVRSTWLVSAAALPLLRAAGAEHGRALVVTTSSILGRFPQAWSPAYSASKAAQQAVSQSLQHELAATGVRVTTLAPSYVATPMTEPLTHLERNQMITAEDVAEAVRFLTRLSPNCVVPEIQLLRPSDHLLPA
jgi:NAD(P)-dependent dehydrogenase (short-subunit alcohol dehydrogenase family)